MDEELKLAMVGNELDKKYRTVRDFLSKEYGYSPHTIKEVLAICGSAVSESDKPSDFLSLCYPDIELEAEGADGACFKDKWILLCFEFDTDLNYDTSLYEIESLSDVEDDFVREIYDENPCLSEGICVFDQNKLYEAISEYLHNEHCGGRAIVTDEYVLCPIREENEDRLFDTILSDNQIGKDIIQRLKYLSHTEPRDIIDEIGKHIDIAILSEYADCETPEDFES